MPMTVTRIFPRIASIRLIPSVQESGPDKVGKGFPSPVCDTGLQTLRIDCKEYSKSGWPYQFLQEFPLWTAKVYLIGDPGHKKPLEIHLNYCKLGTYANQSLQKIVMLASRRPMNVFWIALWAAWSESLSIELPSGLVSGNE
jgi:hypothetical protein